MGLAAAAADSQLDCGEWKTWALDEKPTVADIVYYLEGGVDPNEPDEYGRTLLHRATRYGSEATGVLIQKIKALVAAGADLNAQDGDGEAPLHTAAAAGRYEHIIKALLDAGADPNLQDGSGETPLHKAVRNRDATLGWRPSVIKALLDAGADPGVKNTAGRVPWDFVEDREELGDYQ